MPAPSTGSSGAGLDSAFREALRRLTGWIAQLAGNLNLHARHAFTGLQAFAAGVFIVARRWGMATLVGSKRFLGLLHGEPPIAVGTLQGEYLAPMRRSDRPAWARIVRSIAWLPAAAAVAVVGFVWWTIRPILFMFRLMSGSLFAGGLMRGLMFGAAAGVGGTSLYNKIKSKRNVYLWELSDSSGGRVLVRIALPEDHGYDILAGDDLEIWGKRGSDGAIRAYALSNRRNSNRVVPPFVSTARWVFFAIGLAILLLVVPKLIGGVL